VAPKPKENEAELTIYFVNHATYLIQVDGVNILTDPIFSKRASPVSWAGPKRVIRPGFRKEDIPEVDFVLISHDHYDHLDRDSLEFFKDRDDPKILAGLEVSKYFSEDYKFKELSWWERVVEERNSRHKSSKEDLVFTFVPAQHFSGRGLFDRNSTLWGGFVIEASGKTLFFAGDTGFGSHFQEIKKRFSEIHVSFLPIGAYEPRYFMAPKHINPQEAVEVHRIMGSNISFGMHWGTFQLTNEARLAPMRALSKSLEKTGLSGFIASQNGDCYRVVKENEIQSCHR
jgi:L-ascorbate metabolism protein UlaG (beta-lactamase superfamily)